MVSFSRSFSIFRIFALLAIIGVPLAIWSVFIEPSLLRINHYELALRHWPASLSGLKVAVIADIHAGSPHIDEEKLDEIVEVTNAEQPDLILLARDYVVQRVVGGQYMPPAVIAQHLALLTAPLGVYGVIGNHDNWDDNAKTIKAFTAANIPLIEDASVQIQTTEPFYLAGISDFTTAPHNVSKALDAIPADATVIALSHSPDVFPAIPEQVALTVTGHTHGGQVYIPFIGRPIVPSIYGQRYVKGLIEENGHSLFVSSGIGTSIIPIRFMTPPEVSILTLRAASQ